MLIWNEHDHELHEVFSVHKSAVKVIKWSNNGNRLVSGDEVGITLEIILYYKVNTFE